MNVSLIYFNPAILKKNRDMFVQQIHNTFFSDLTEPIENDYAGALYIQNSDES